MRESAVHAHTHNLGVTSLELFFESFEARYVLGSSGCPIERIEHQHYIFLPFELTQGEFGSAQVTGQLKIRCLLTNSDHAYSPSFDLGGSLASSIEYRRLRRIFNAL